MNITGMPSYSRETVGLRQPNKILDQQFRLIYAYPLIFCDTLNNQNFKADIRQFLAISFLREIFVSNSLNIIQMASQIPTVDQNDINVADVIGKAVLSGGGTNLPNTSYPSMYQNTSAYELQHQVEKKTNQIMKYLLSDPRTKKLMPQIEIVTMNNMIDVPVIVGTKDYTAPSYPLIYVLIIAVLTNTPLDKLTNIDKIVRVLKKTNQKDWITLLARFTEDEKDAKNLATWANMSVRKSKKFLGIFKRKQKDDDENIPVQRRNLSPDTEYDPVETEGLFNILKLMKNELNDLALQFKFVLNTDLLKNQIGLDISNNTMETTVMKLSNNQQQIFMGMHDKFMELLSIPGSIFLSSVFNTLYPMPTPEYDDDGAVIRSEPQTKHRLNFLELKDKHIDQRLNAKVQELIFDTYVSEIKNSLMQYSPAESKVKVDLLKSICKSMDQVDNFVEGAIQKFVNDDNNVISTINFSEDNMDDFTKSIHKLASSFIPQTKRFENVFSQLVKNGKSILTLTKSQIYSSLEAFMESIYNNRPYTSAMEYHHGVDGDDVKKIYIPQMTDTLFVIFYFFFLYRLQAALCQYIEVLDVEIESKVNDVFDFPNYTLVITTDILKSVYTANMATNLKNLLSSGQVYQVGKMTQNNIKGMMRYLRTRMKIPSLIVYDEQRKDVYYQFMFMSSPEKISNTALDSFIKSNS